MIETKNHLPQSSQESSILINRIKLGRIN